MKKYLLGGLLFAVLEMSLYEIGFKLSEVWYSYVNRIEDYQNFCRALDSVGNCLDFHRHTFFAWLGLFGVPLIVLVLFFILLFKQKKSRNALCLIVCYALPMLIFHFGLIHIHSIDELWQWLEIANVFGVISSAGIIIISFSAAGIFYLHNRFLQMKRLSRT
ncbi:MAG: hypothetical protein WC641_07075 [Patescibacteria group bacterium]